MSVRITLSGNYLALGNHFSRIGRQVPFAAARALTDTVKQAEKDYRAKLPSIFDRPTPFTLNSAFTRPATKANLEAAVELRHFAGKGTPADKYLGPEILGGPRGMKRFERRLDFGGISGGRFAVPGRQVQLDAYGNLSRGQIMQILSRLQVMGEQNVGPRTTAKLRRAGLLVRQGKRVLPGNYFVAHSKQDGGPIGIYQLVSKGKVVPVLIFTRAAPTYRKRLDFYGIIGTSAQKNFGPAFKKRLAEAIATAR